MLKKENRLPRGFLKSESTINSYLYVFKIAKNQKNVSRFGFIVSKKIDKRATVRNRIRRKFRSCIEERLSEIERGYDFLFIFKKNIEKTNYCEILFGQLEKGSYLKK